MTPFKIAGYTKDTKFKVLVNGDSLKTGDIVTLYEDDGSKWPYFITEDGRKGEMFLPCMGFVGEPEDLEVYEESKELTPFEKTGYTKDAKFSVLIDYDELEVGDIVTLDYDDRTDCPEFKTEDGRAAAMHLPDYRYSTELELYEEGRYTKNNTTLSCNCVSTVINLDNVKVFKDIDQYQVSNEAENFVSGGLPKKRAYSLTQEL